MEAVDDSHTLAKTQPTQAGMQAWAAPMTVEQDPVAVLEKVADQALTGPEIKEVRRMLLIEAPAGEQLGLRFLEK